MTKYMPDQNRTCFLYESGIYAVVSGNRQWLGLVQDHSCEPNMNVTQIRYQGSTNRDVNDTVNGMQEFDGTISYYPQDWKMLGFALGSIQDLTGSHIFTESNSDDRVQVSATPLYHFSIEDSKNIGNAGSNFIRTINGCVIDSYELSFSQGEVLSCDVSYVAQTETLSSGAVTALGSTTTKPYMFNEVKFYIPEATQISNLKEGTFSINNNLERGNYLNGSRVSSEMLPMNREYEMSATCAMDDSNARTLYNSYYIAGSEFNAALKVWGVAGSLTLIMSGCKMTEMSVPSPLEDVQDQEFTFVPKNVYGTAMDSITTYNAW